MLNDSQQRAKATDPFNSYIVQAPAGSGKTEILTQRYLRLLSGVTAPEQIIALTFTRKAANEMRERILKALQLAANNTPATSSHQQQTLAFAADALARDKTLNWQLLQQPGRLRIITIDSLCQTLTHAIPLQDKQIPYAQICDKPQSHYIAAARACLTYAIENTSYHSCIKTLLRHVDNRRDNLLSLLSSLLANRDQWLHLLYQAKEQNKETYEQALAWIEQHELIRLQQSIPEEYAKELTSLIRRLINIQTYPDSPLQHWEDFNQLNRQIVTHLAAILLTSQDTLRKALDHHVGLKRGECSNEDYDYLKANSKHLFSQLAESPDFLPALIRVKSLPTPQYNSEQWDVLQALLTLLPVLAAHLHVIFSEHNEVDFTAISEQALRALGDDEYPTDLALYLDNSIHHLLVDEFQDTSIQQFQLLSRLVQSWQPNDGKTLFVVGDPMQSIYRFRSAEVGLFLRAQQHGIGPIQLIPLELDCNFRSTANIVNWVNHQFKSIFPQTDDIESGAISFHPSVHVKSADEHSFVMSFQYENRAQEATALVKRISAELALYPTDEIAILVRSRKQLSDIVQCLREHKIPFQGIEIDALAQLPHLRDIWSLTQALLMPSNRLAWLAMLRSPWCGLSLTDLLHIAQFSKNESIYVALSKLEEIPNISDEGRLRAHFIFTVFQHAFACRHQQPLIAWISAVLKQLHLEKLLGPSEQDDVEQFWLLLERFEKHGQIEDITQFNYEFNKLYSQRVVPSRLKIMTIHKSKGLEFDCVILPGLSTRPPGLDTPLLRWLKLPSQDHEELLLLSPMKAAHHEECLLYNYLGQLDAQKNSYELQRLLYVAATRAKKRLYLFDNSEKCVQGTFRSLLQQQEFTIAKQEISYVETVNLLPPLYQLPIAFYQPIGHPQDNNKSRPMSKLATVDEVRGEAARRNGMYTQVHEDSSTDLTKQFASAVAFRQRSNEIPSITINTTPRLVGIVAHELLQWVCNHHPTTSTEIPWELANHQLKSSGFDAVELEAAQHQIKTQLVQFFNDPIGQWLIKKHEHECNEYELLVDEHNALSTKIIDRTFCENGIRWIVDFKTGLDDESTEARHRQQVDRYAELFVGGEHTSIRCGLYYLASNRWLAWEYTNT